MDKFQIAIFTHKSEKEIKFYTTPESFITLFVYNYLNCSSSIEIKYIQRDISTTNKEKLLRLSNAFLFDNDDYYYSSLIKNINISNETKFDNKLSNKLPMYETENLFIFGVCAICRALILKSKIRTDLLGFKQSCLLAPSEKSIWTKLCEIDMIKAFEEILKYFQISITEISNKEIQLPNCFTIFENHMGQPTRAHNFYKILHKENQNTDNKKSTKNLLTTLEHNFAEGYFFSLVDVILYPTISLLFLVINNTTNAETNNDMSAELFPLTYQWLKRIDKFDNSLQINFNKVLNTNFYKEILHKNCQIDKLNFIKNEIIQINSLYKADLNKGKDKLLFTNQLNIDECLEKISKLNININSTNIEADNIKFNWEQIPKLAKPEFGNLPEQRLKRKSDQLRNLCDAVLKIAKPNDVIVDFCSGTGHLGIILACMLPQCHIIFLENKSISILKSQERCKKLNLKNCSFYQSNIDYFERKFNIGVSLHACGTATDIVLYKCIKVNANFICCPCCYGAISPMPHIKYPLSKLYMKNLFELDYLYIAHAADQSHDITVKNCNLEKRKQGEYCMDIIDTDRKYFAIENGYNDVKLKRLHPENCTPKNRLLIGIK